MPPRLFTALVCHAGLMILLGCLIGFPFNQVLMAQLQLAPVTLPGDYRGWHMAHLEALMNGMLVLAVACAARALPARGWPQPLMFWGLLVAGWGNTLGSLVAAWAGKRVVAPDVGDQQLWAFALFGLAVPAVLAALVGLLAAAWQGWRDAARA